MSYDICMIVHNDILNDSRIWREARTLNAQGWKVMVVCISLGNQELPKIQEIDGFTIKRIMPALFRKRPNLKTIHKLIQLMVALPIACWYMRQSKAKIFHGHDFPGLVIIAMAGIWRRPVIYDSHEVFFDREFKGISRWIIRLLMLMRPLEKHLANKAVAMIATSDGHADQIAKNVDGTRPTVIRNAVDLRRLQERAVEYPRNSQYLVVHSGGIGVGRHLPELIQALQYLPDEILLVLMGNGPMEVSLKQSAEAMGVSHKFAIVPPVPPDAVALTLAQADIGVALITSHDLSYQLSLPNKFFEVIAAGLPILVSGIPAFAKMVEKYEVGLICDPTNPQDIAEKITTLLDDNNFERYRSNVAKAREELNWENEEKKLIAIYQLLLEKKLNFQEEIPQN